MQTERETVIKIDGVSKQYRLGAIGGTTLRDELQRKMAKLRHKEDPTLKIGQEQVQANEKFWALKDISLEVKKGEALGIIGHNGAGKSTLLKLLCRVTAPTEGTIAYNGRIASMLEVGTGFHPELTGRENIYLNGAILGMTRDEIDQKMEDIIEFSECRQFIDTPVKRYSSGMYVKLAFSVAAHLDAEIMIMDEVLAVGDMAFQKKCITKMKHAATEEGRTVLYVSHNMQTIRKLCERCVVLEKGKVVFDGNTEDAISVYMNRADEYKTEYNYKLTKRSINETRKIQMDKLVVMNSKSTVLQGEEIKLVLECHGNAKAQDLGFRFEIFSNDESVIGTSFLDKLIDIHEGERISIGFSLDTSNIAPGNYKAVALFYEADEFGNQVGVDRVDPALYFQVDRKQDLIWLSQYWGHIQINNLTLLGIKREE